MWEVYFLQNFKWSDSALYCRRLSWTGSRRGINTLEADVGTLACKAGYVYQDFENQIVRPTVLDDASYACLNYAMEDYRERGLEALKLCGLEGKEEDYIWQLSGGQTHLLALAGAVSLGRIF